MKSDKSSAYVIPKLFSIDVFNSLILSDILFATASPSLSHPSATVKPSSIFCLAVIIASAKVGGILANENFSADFIYQNLMIQTNLIHSSFLAGVKNLIFLGSSCIYPKYAKQPLKEEYLLTGKLEPTNESYAIAKIAGLKMCESYNKQYNLNYICLMPTNLYGPNDNYDLNTSHFFPALIKKIYYAKKIKKILLKYWEIENKK